MTFLCKTRALHNLNVERFFKYESIFMKNSRKILKNEIVEVFFLDIIDILDPDNCRHYFSTKKTSNTFKIQILPITRRKMCQF